MKGLSQSDLSGIAYNANLARVELARYFSGPLVNELLIEIVRADAQGRAND